MLVFIGVLKIHDRLFENSIVWLVLLAFASEMLCEVLATIDTSFIEFSLLDSINFCWGFVGVFVVSSVNEQYTLKSKFSGGFWDVSDKTTGFTLILFLALLHKISFFGTSKCLLFPIFLSWRFENLLIFCMFFTVSALVKLNIDGA